MWSSLACKYFFSSLTGAGVFCAEFWACEGTRHVCSQNPEASRETDFVRRKVKVGSWEGSRSNGERLLPLSFETAGMGCLLKLWEFRLITGAVALKPWLCRHWQLWGSVEKGYGLRNQLVKGIKWNSLHHKSVLNSFNFPALISACFNCKLLCTLKNKLHQWIFHTWMGLVTDIKKKK